MTIVENQPENLQGPWANPEVLLQYFVRHAGVEAELASRHLQSLAPHLRMRAVHGMLGIMLDDAVGHGAPGPMVQPVSLAAGLHATWAQGGAVERDHKADVTSCVQRVLKEDYSADKLTFAAGAATSLQPAYYPETAHALRGFETPTRAAAESMGCYLIQAIYQVERAAAGKPPIQPASHPRSHWYGGR